MDCQLSEEEIIFIIENVFYLKMVKSKITHRFFMVGHQLITVFEKYNG